MNEEDIPAEQPSSQKESWFPRSHEDARRPSGIEGSPSERPQGLVRLICTVEVKVTSVTFFVAKTFIFFVREALEKISIEKVPDN